MHDSRIGYVEITRVIMARHMKIPPDDIDMSSIFRCVQRAIEEKVEKNLDVDQMELAPANPREMRAVVSEAGETIIPMIFRGEYPFEDFVKNYEVWYEENLAAQFLKMKLEAMSEEKRI